MEIGQQAVLWHVCKDKRLGLFCCCWGGGGATSTLCLTLQASSFPITFWIQAWLCDALCWALHSLQNAAPRGGFTHMPIWSRHPFALEGRCKTFRQEVWSLLLKALFVATGQRGVSPQQVLQTDHFAETPQRTNERLQMSPVLGQQFLKYVFTIRLL